MDSAHLLVGGVRVAPLEIATTRRERGRGLLGREAYDGALMLAGVRSVHTVGMRFAIDVAFARWADAYPSRSYRLGSPHANRRANIVEIVGMQPNRVGRPRRCDFIIEAQQGAMAAWGLEVDRPITIDRECTDDG